MRSRNFLLASASASRRCFSTAAVLPESFGREADGTWGLRPGANGRLLDDALGLQKMCLKQSLIRICQ